MIVKSYELNKVNLDENKFILLYGKNDGHKIEIINLLTKNVSKISRYEESDILYNENHFLDDLLNRSLFDEQKIIVIQRSSEKIINGKVYPIVYRSECKKCRRTGGKANSSAAKKLMKQLNMTRPKTPIPCHCCKKVTKRLTFDHDHTTNKFRGWLCYQCNSAIGNLGDSIEGLTRALEYLTRAEKIK